MDETPSQYRTILLFGMPGSGKGTQGSVLGQLPDLVHVSSGDVFRKLPKYGSLGREIGQYTSQGMMVPDELTIRIYQRHIQVLELQEFLIPGRTTLVLDGIPRNYGQAEIMEPMPPWLAKPMRTSPESALCEKTLPGRELSRSGLCTIASGIL